ncbi:TrmH family RNA methyltransferase [Nonlabens ulvanivorans]|uniref:RNA methyltransferase n=1 Tax=Nonlabens ulvanivorans TaxID=906888 RepID=A0A084JV73_NONUL|nr:RNA methyltransferase [Nonlabens ulvanivorans]KEZ92857.1 RNA methyltransferase [Nonlabens ulvanivorans]PRX15712.1 TrmH family RNA methyltransferase [Nonlabens ulvanivorans]
MVTKSRLKLLKSLSRKKNRDDHQLFLVEGYKSILELSQTDLVRQQVLVTEGHHALDSLPTDIISKKDMSGVSTLKTPPGYLAVFEMPVKKEINVDGLVVALDDVKDPGNLGTIIRLCDWFDIKQIICSEETVDVFNPKCVQASMASLGRVQVDYVNLEEFLKDAQLDIYTTAMDGTSIYNMSLPENGILVMGNESAGISEEIMSLGSKISIPQYGSQPSTESLNVAMATAVVLGEWRRSTEK